MAVSPKTATLLIRLILLPPVIVFGLMAYNYLSHPVTSVVALGIVASSPLAVTTLRIFFGAFPLGCCLFILACIFSTRRLLTGLALSGTITGAVFVVRVLGMFADGTVQRNFPAAVAEAIVLVLTFVGIFLDRGRRA